MKKQPRQNNVFLIALVILLLVAGLVVYFKSAFIVPQQSSLITSTMSSYTSKDLKISFQYPKNWHIDNRDGMILLTTYQTNLNENVSPSPSELDVLISEFSYCFKTIEEDLVKPACGQGGPQSYNTIVSHQSKITQGGTFFTYTIKSPQGVISNYYLLQKGDRILQISKQPDPSQFENEFNAIVNSIKFL